MMLPLLAEGDANYLLIAIGSILLVATFIRIILRHRRAPTETSSVKIPDEHATAEQLRDLHAKLITEFEQLADEKLARLETRIRVLDALLLRAEGKGVSTEPSVLSKITDMLAKGVPPDAVARKFDLRVEDVELIVGLSSTRNEVKK